MHRVLVTGGTGFLGSHLCERLFERGDEAICLDKFYTGRRSTRIGLDRGLELTVGWFRKELGLE